MVNQSLKAQEEETDIEMARLYASYNEVRSKVFNVRSSVKIVQWQTHKSVWNKFDQTWFTILQIWYKEKNEMN